MPVSSFSSKDPFRREENDDKTQDSSPPLPSSGWTTTTSSVPQSFWSTSTTDHANNNSDSISPESGSSSSSSSSSSIRMALGGPIQEEEEHNHSNGSNVLSGPIPMERVSDNAHSSSSLAWVSTTTLNASWYARNQYPSTILEEEDQPQQPPTVARQKSPPRSPYALRVRGGGGIGQAPEGDFEEEEEEDYTNLHDERDRNSQTNHSTPASPFLKSSSSPSPSPSSVYFVPLYTVTHCLEYVSLHWLHWDCHVHSRAMASATWIGFWALLHVTCATYVLTPMRDAIALAVGVDAMPQLTLASTVLAFCSSVPIGWLFEAPDPSRRLVWKRMGLTRGETQGTSLALFYRCFALILISYAIGFPLLEWIHTTVLRTTTNNNNNSTANSAMMMDAPQEERLLHEQEAPNENAFHEWVSTVLSMVPHVTTMVSMMRQGLYIAFFLVVHLMKLHSLSLVWGVTTEAMEYEDVARQKQQAQAEPVTDKDPNTTTPTFPKPITRLQRLGLIGFGGTLGGILGSVLASTLAQILYLSGLLVLAAVLLEISAELSIELGRIMQQHWVEQQEELFQQQQQQQQQSSSSMPLDTSIRRTVSLGSMKRVASGNSLNRVRSATDLKSMSSSTDATSSSSPSSPGVLVSSTHSSPLRNSTAASVSSHKSTAEHNNNKETSPSTSDEFNDNTFFQRLLRGVTTILRSRFLMAIFTYNALYASTTVLLSFQRAALVANRNATASAVASNTAADLAFLANINMASSVAIFALQASGAGALLAQLCGPRGTLALMPLIRLAGVLALAWWHHTSHGQPPNLVVFLVVDECCKIMNLAVAKPVRESLWRGLSNEARYEAKPIVDTLANRWGGGSAAFLVSTLNKLLDVLIGPDDDTDEETGTILSSSSSRLVLGCPPLLFLCIVLSAWWAAVSIDLGQIRKSIDLELKKRQ